MLKNNFDYKNTKTSTIDFSVKLAKQVKTLNTVFVGANVGYSSAYNLKQFGITSGFVFNFVIMKRLSVVFVTFSFVVLSIVLLSNKSIDDLRTLYSRPISEWPKPNIDSGVVWSEFKSLPKIDSSYFKTMDRPVVKLGKTLFLTLSFQGQIKYLVALVTIHRQHGQTIYPYRQGMTTNKELEIAFHC